MTDFEKLGAFYLGKTCSPDTKERTDEVLLYDARDLTTHAVCVGMTGSGKTGLCLALLEEAALDGIPALAIDPKGDLGNLLLAFPDLAPSSFLPWIDPAEAARKGCTPDELAEKTASLWKNGLAEWGEDGERIARFRSAADVAIYTPGSSAGLPLNVLGSFAAPSAALLADEDFLRDRVASAVSGLLALLGIEADPLQSREHILLSTILHKTWTQQKDLDLPSLIQAIQKPPFETVGVMGVDAFYPAKERLALAMRLNNLLASPGFSAWMEGEPLDVGRLLWTPEGKPRIAILSIAHLEDAERMFFVTQVLNETVSWMRAQSGTSSLRAILYMDEVFGYFPPTANPPSKTPMLTLLKQARAYGLGVVLATQNPVDLDYKGLSNAGTWFLGRLQTERDKARVLDGLEGASSGAAFDRGETERILSGLESRVFLMNNVHEDAPTLFQTRWALSYLRGPLTRTQIQTLMAPRKAASPPAAARTPAAPTAAETPQWPTAPTPAAASSGRPAVSPDVPEVFLAPRGPVPAEYRLEYRPLLLGEARLHFVQATAGVDAWTEAFLLGSTETADPWEGATILEKRPAVGSAPEPGATFAQASSLALQAKTYRSWGKALVESLYRTRTLRVWKCAALKETSKPGESDASFRVRLGHALREKRDEEKSKLERKYAPKLAAIQDRIRRAQTRIEKEKAQYEQQKLQSAVSVGSTLLGALFGRKVASARNMGRAGTAVNRMGRAAKERGDIQHASEDRDAQMQSLAELEAAFREELAALEGTLSPSDLQLTEVQIRPRKTDITIQAVALAWAPWRVGKDGGGEPWFGA